jgi:hypothetical protein
MSHPSDDDLQMSPPLGSAVVAPSAGQLAGLLADADRRMVVAAIVLGAQSVDEVRRAAVLGLREAVTATGRLVDGGLVEQAADGTLVLVASASSAAARAAAPIGGDEHADQPAEIARVLRAHVKDGRLTSIPSGHAKRLIVLALIVQDFELDTHYLEPEVNTILARWHPDTAALRRWLVDVGYLDRDHGDYWRCGGPVTLSTQERTGSASHSVELRAGSPSRRNSERRA